MIRRLFGSGSKDVLKALLKGGFEVRRIRGRFHALVHRDDPKRIAIIAVHGNAALPPGTIKSIRTQAGLTREEFIALL